MNILNDPMDLLPLALVFVIVLLILEVILSLTWNRLYFTIGLPIFIRRIPVNAYLLAPLDTGQMEKQFHGSFTTKAIAFKELAPNLYAFREKFFEIRLMKMRSAPVMHGCLILDQSQQQVVVKGYLNWSFLAFSLVIFAMVTLDNQSWEFALMVLLVVSIILVISYGVQSAQYAKIADAAAEEAGASRQ